MKSEEVRTWYNSFSKNQAETGVNLRHYSIIGHLKEAGLQKSHTVLELGCGIGTLTGLIHDYLGDKGKLVATDISDASVEMAKKLIRNSDKIDFFVTDMKGFTYPKKFDFIVLPDVLEHIPVEDHAELFKTLSGVMHDQSVILIHIPHPQALDYTREHFPERLQIIDQSLSAEKLMTDAYASGLILHSYRSYSLFHEQPDYALIRFRMNVPYGKYKPLKKSAIIRAKFIARLKHAIS